MLRAGARNIHTSPLRRPAPEGADFVLFPAPVRRLLSVSGPEGVRRGLREACVGADLCGRYSIETDRGHLRLIRTVEAGRLEGLRERHAVLRSGGCR